MQVYYHFVSVLAPVQGIVAVSAGIGSLKGVEMAVCGIKCIDLTTETINILGVHFSYHQKLQTPKNFVKRITNMEMSYFYG